MRNFGCGPETYVATQKGIPGSGLLGVIPCEYAASSVLNTSEPRPVQVENGDRPGGSRESSAQRPVTEPDGAARHLNDDTSAPIADSMLLRGPALSR